MGCCLDSDISKGEIELDECSASWSTDQEVSNIYSQLPVSPSIIKLPAQATVSQMAMCLSLTKTINVSDGGLFSSQSLSESLVCHPPITEVTTQLYFGSYQDALNEEWLRENKVTHIISLIGPTHIIQGIKHMHRPMNDNGQTDLQQVFEQLWPFIEESQQPGSSLFVHCMSGQNRSATVILGILMKSQMYRLDEARRIIQEKRPVVQINEQYAQQLTQMEREIFGRISVPADWMNITSVNMETGEIFFSGDSLHNKDSTNSTGNNTASPIKPNRYSMRNIGSFTAQYVD